MAGRRIELGRALAGEIGAAVARPDDVRAYPMDVTDAASIAAAMAAIVAELGVPGIVVNNAGVPARAPSLELSEARWQGAIDVNLSGVFRVAQASAREMVRAGTGGTIINIASILGLRVRAQVAAYAASKAAVVQLTHALALEWAEHGIRVNAIAPGYFDTDINRDLLKTPVGQAIVARIPQGRVGNARRARRAAAAAGIGRVDVHDRRGPCGRRGTSGRTRSDHRVLARIRPAPITRPSRRTRSTTFAHFAVSAAMTLPKSSGVPAIGLPPSSARRSRIFGSASARLTSALTFSMTSRGVPFGMPMPNQAVAS